MRIAIIGLNDVSKFYGVVWAMYGHEVFIYRSENNSLKKERKDIIVEKNFFYNYIKKLKFFNDLVYDEKEIDVIEKFMFKEETKKECFIFLENTVCIDDFTIDKIPNLEILDLKTSSINQIKLMEDLLVIDSNDDIFLSQLNLKKKNNWACMKITSKEIKDGFQITKQNNYSIFAFEKDKKMEIMINFKLNKRSDIIKIIQKNFKNYTIEYQNLIKKYDNYSYKNIAIVNNALEEINFSYRDYSLLTQIIQNIESKKIYSGLDIYSDIKSKVI